MRFAGWLWTNLHSFERFEFSPSCFLFSSWGRTTSSCMFFSLASSWIYWFSWVVLRVSILSSILAFLEASLKDRSLNGSNNTWTDSLTINVHLLKTQNALLMVEYSKKIVSSDFESNFSKLSLPLFNNICTQKYERNLCLFFFLSIVHKGFSLVLV